MMVALWVAGRRKLSTLLIAAGTFVATLVPLVVWFYLHPQTYLDTYGRWAIFAAHLRNPVDGFRAFVNTNTLGTRASAYWSLIDPSYLFFSSARSTRAAADGVGAIDRGGRHSLCATGPRHRGRGRPRRPAGGATGRIEFRRAATTSRSRWRCCRLRRSSRPTASRRFASSSSAGRSPFQKSRRRVKPCEPSSEATVVSSALPQRLAARCDVPRHSSGAPGARHRAAASSRKVDARSIMSIRPVGDRVEPPGAMHPLDLAG